MNLLINCPLKRAHSNARCKLQRGRLTTHELSEFFPRAKIILTVRSPSDWYESMRSTVVEVMRRPSLVPDAGSQEVLRTAQRLVLDGFCGGRFDDVEETNSREAIKR